MASAPEQPKLDESGRVLTRVDPRSVRRIHLLGIGGTGMGSFAGLLKAAGYAVTGSDEKLYPPMSDMLKAWAIPVLTPYHPENLSRANPDLVIVGNVIRRVNPEATEVRTRGLPQMSFPAALAALFLEKRHSVVVAGTHGKTTTSAMLAHVLVAAGKDPSFLVGGVALNYSGNYRLGGGKHFVVEGDEYDTAYFDKGPKFLHYQPRTAILTSVELDHVDIYRDLAHYESSFEAFVRLIPHDGFLAVSASYPNAVALAKASSRAAIAVYGGDAEAQADYQAANLRFSSEGAQFDLFERGENLGSLTLPMAGRHNVENAVGMSAALRALGLSLEEIRAGLASFSGVKRRQEVRADLGGILVVDDFAHHPTAVRETIAAIHLRYPERSIWAVFEPRSNTSRRNLHQEEYSHAFLGAKRATIKVPERHDKVPTGEELDVPQLLTALHRQGIHAEADGDVEQLVQRVSDEAQPGQLILAMSNGSFGGFVDKLIQALRSKGGEPG